MNKKQIKSNKKSKKVTKKSFTITFSKKDDLRYVLFMNQCKDRTQFLRDCIDKAINEERMKESLWDMN